MSRIAMAASIDLQETLKPYHQRASEAEERLARLEAAIATTQGSGNKELSNKVAERQRMLDAKSEQLAKKEKAFERVLKKTLNSITG